MRYKLFYDNNRKIPLFSAESREQALACAETAEEELCVALFPSLRADIGVLFRSALWGSLIPLEGLRAVGFYFGKILGWPMKEIVAECEDKSLISIPTFCDKTEEVQIKTNVCKQLFENICIYTHSVSHSAYLFAPPYSFIMVESSLVEAVDFSALQGLCSDRDIGGLPLCFAALDKEKISLRVMRRTAGELMADDYICLYALSCFLKTERAVYGKEYEACFGRYRIEKDGTAVAIRPLKRIL